MALLDGEIWRGRVYSGGWVTASGGDAPVTEPATGAELGRTGIGLPADIASAARQAAAAQRAWADRPHSERSALLRRAADIWLANAAEIEQWNIRESVAGIIAGWLFARSLNTAHQWRLPGAVPGKRPVHQSQSPVATG